MLTNNLKKAFTLVELLIVIAILAILAAAVVIVINPGEMLAQARDAERISSIESLKKSIDLFVLDNPGTTLGTYQKIYISIPDTSATCANITGLPTLPSGWTYNCVTTANLRNLDSTGWLPINLTSIKGGSPMPSLPIDPQNTQATTRYYQYIPGNTSGSYELTTLLESEKQAKIAGKDGGVDPGRLETGTDLSLWKQPLMMRGYWNLDGTLGAISNGQSIFPDLSGTGNNGASVNTNGIGMSFVAGKLGTAVQFDGTDDKVEIPNNSTLDCTGELTIMAWIKTSSTGSSEDVITKYGLGGSGLSYMLVSGANSTGRVSFYNSGWFNTNKATNNNTWHHVAATTNGSTYKVYIDGLVNISGSTSSISISTSTVAIGGPNSNNWGSYFNGAIDEAAIYNRVLTDGEIQAIYNSIK